MAPWRRALELRALGVTGARSSRVVVGAGGVRTPHFGFVFDSDSSYTRPLKLHNRDEVVHGPPLPSLGSRGSCTIYLSAQFVRHLTSARKAGKSCRITHES